MGYRTAPEQLSVPQLEAGGKWVESWSEMFYSTVGCQVIRRHNTRRREISTRMKNKKREKG